MSLRLAAAECSGITFLAPDGSFPVFWERALGANVWDVDGNRLVDLTSAFGVAACGHTHPALVEAAAAQASTLMHGMGDVHPPRVKLELLERLGALTAGRLGHGILGLNGADAVEAALKCAWFATGKPGIVAFEGGYHGLLGFSLESVGHSRFRAPFSPLLASRTTLLPYPYPLRHPEGPDPSAVLGAALAAVEARLASADGPPVGAVLVEPIQARGGEVVPPEGFLGGLLALCERYGALLIADEIYTGLGRSGALFASERDGVWPHLMVLGKALTGGLPLSVCLGRPEVMAQWPKSAGEAVHTSTFLGNPLACAVALASLRLIETLRLPLRSERMGQRAKARLRRSLAGVAGVAEVRGAGLLMGVELVVPGGLVPNAAAAEKAMTLALAHGVLVLPSGRHGNVIGLSPPLTIAEPLLDAALDVVAACIREALR
jgi:4-aminobutyrate aminotransferase-like enzyme